VTAGAASAILRRAFELSPTIRGLPVAAWWSGLRPLSGDGIPLVGFWPGVSGLLIASGHGRNGILLAPVTAETVVDCLEGRATPATAAMDPSRFAAAESLRR
jgi:glycine oxidase